MQVERARARARERESRDGKEPSFIGFGSVRVLVNFLNGVFWFCSVLSKKRVLVRFVRFGFGSIPISKREREKITADAERSETD